MDQMCNNDIHFIYICSDYCKSKLGVLNFIFIDQFSVAPTPVATLVNYGTQRVNGCANE